MQRWEPTIPHTMNPNCVHVHGPTGVKLATRKIRQVLEEQEINFIIRAD
jgi:hypothetical protein